MASLNNRPVALAAGGTGGHIFPAEALAEVLVARGVSTVFVTDKRYKQYGGSVTLARLPMHTIQAGTLGGGGLKKLKNGCGIIIGIVQAMWVLRAIKARVVVGFGGYPSFPTMMAASLLRIPTVIHEQNSVLGKANRVLGKRVKTIATTYAVTQRMPRDTHAQVQWVGNPVRAAVKAVAQVASPELRGDGVLKILVIGGSQGASVFSDVLPAAMVLLPQQLRARIRIDQQCRAPEMEKTRAAYQGLNMSVDLAPFFHDVPARLAGAHLVISRSGASTVAELTAAGRPAILVPYPKATDNHQYFNAQAVEDVGGGWVMAQDGFTPQAVAARLETFLTNPQVLSDAAQAIRTLGRPEAAEELANLVLAA